MILLIKGTEQEARVAATRHGVTISNVRQRERLGRPECYADAPDDHGTIMAVCAWHDADECVPGQGYLPGSLLIYN